MKKSTDFFFVGAVIAFTTALTLATYPMLSSVCLLLLVLCVAGFVNKNV